MAIFQGALKVPSGAKAAVVDRREVCMTGRTKDMPDAARVSVFSRLMVIIFSKGRSRGFT
jgi:hypothetical protein